MIVIENISFGYGDNQVLDGLSVSLPVNSIHGLVGMNGSGKTTLLKVIAGYLKPRSGSVGLHGHPVRKEEISFLETENFFYSYITGREYLELFRTPSGAPALEAWNQLFKLPLDQLIEGYSSGMKRKLALAGVLRQDKQVVILDEPFNGLDLESSRLLSMILTRMKERGKTVIITSHILGSLTGICDRIHYLQNGRISLSRGREDFQFLEKEIFSDVDSGYIDMVNHLI
jgi:ABC-2 type transport system ATP-binding protein